jgi:pyrroline-5-carboxylate reductase
VLHAANRSPGTLRELAAAFPGLRTGSVEAVAADCELVFLCIPPSAYRSVAAACSAAMRPDAVLVCISNGVALASLAEVVRQPVVKVVPSLAHEAGRGIALVIEGPRAGARDVERVERFLAPFATTMRIDESDSRVATNLTGCGPALFACFAETLARTAAALSVGLTREQLRAMSVETLVGTAALLDAKRSGAEIIEGVATPGGSTERALAVLYARLPGLLDEMHRATSPHLATKNLTEKSASLADTTGESPRGERG